jgi:UDP-MurNAc hydroxylase
MRVTFLGHAGFLVETSGAVVVADPWLSPGGAFDGGWMQFPQNHHLAPEVRARLERRDKPAYVYLSHEHEDHFDVAFLATLPLADLTFVVPRFSRSALRDQLAALGAQVVACDDGGEVPIAGGGSLHLFVEERGFNRDSALLLRADGRSFLDLNDCKIHDRLAAIVAAEGPIDVFTAQFSGAIWHPPCYDYDPKTYAATSKRKMMSKFEAVARAIDVVSPRTFLASAGPACFLDPRLFHINLEPLNIFPRASTFFAYVGKRLRNSKTILHEPMPGDVLEVATGELQALGTERVGGDLEAYLRAYADRMAPRFADRAEDLPLEARELVLDRLEFELARKLEQLSLRDRIEHPLYVGLEGLADRWVRVDFRGHAVSVAHELPDDHRHVLTARARDLAPVVERTMTWEQFLLSLRHRMSRRPDAYDPVLHGYLALETEDLPAFCEGVLAAEARKERIVVQAEGREYSVHRYCPHQGADLREGWITGSCLTCPRHRWEFDLEAGGRCTTNASTIEARAVEPDAPELPAVPAVASGV